MQASERLAVQVEHYGIGAADDGERGRLHAFKGVACEIGPAAARHHGVNQIGKIRRSH